MDACEPQTLATSSLLTEKVDVEATTQTPLPDRRPTFVLLAGVVLFILSCVKLSLDSSFARGLCFHNCSNNLGTSAGDTVSITNKFALTFDDRVVIKDRVATIFEDRPLQELIPLLLHFSTILGPEWPIVLFTSQNVIPDSAPFKRLIDETRLTVRFLPPTITFQDRNAVSAFLTKPWIWEQLAPAEHVLLFQADSILCANAPQKVDDYLQYDFIGGPVDQSVRHGEMYNGGLSLRNRAMMLDIIENFDWQDEYNTAKDREEPGVAYEDAWFYKKMEDLVTAGQRVNLPSLEVALTFAVDTLWYDKPLGFQQASRWQSANIDKVVAWCPEHRMAPHSLDSTR